jgi:hypothetical protein
MRSATSSTSALSHFGIDAVDEHETPAQFQQDLAGLLNVQHGAERAQGAAKSTGETPVPRSPRLALRTSVNSVPPRRRTRPWAVTTTWSSSGSSQMVRRRTGEVDGPRTGSSAMSPAMPAARPPEW